VAAKADLQEHAQRRQKDGNDETKNIHGCVGLQNAVPQGLCISPT
jgi:hypothetical protein